jgi:hypothetical protein
MEFVASDLPIILVQADNALLRLAGQRQENLDQIHATQRLLADLEQAKQEAFQACINLLPDQIRRGRTLRTRLCQLHTEYEAFQIERDHILNARGQALGRLD